MKDFLDKRVKTLLSQDSRPEAARFLMDISTTNEFELQQIVHKHGGILHTFMGGMRKATATLPLDQVETFASTTSFVDLVYLPAAYKIEGE